MKLFFLIFLTLCTVQSSYSQTEKGRYFIGGYAGLFGSEYGLVKADNSEINSVYLILGSNLGYYIKDNLAIGIHANLTASHSVQKLELINRNSNSTTKTPLDYNFGGFVRRYIPIAKRFMFYLNGEVYSSNIKHVSESSASYPSRPSNNYNTTANSRTKYLSLSIAPGFAYFITPKIEIKTSIGGLYYSTESFQVTSTSSSDYKVTTNNFGLTLAPSTINLGFNYYF